MNFYIKKEIFKAKQQKEIEENKQKYLRDIYF